MNGRAFTIRYSGIQRVLSTSIGISLPSQNEDELRKITIKNYQAIWDTGATNSVITSKVVKELQLKPTSVIQVSTANGISQQNAYLTNIYLPNQFCVPFVRVTECISLTDEFHVLIGMDIISLGDFIVNNYRNHTQFSFRMPSSHEIDYEEILKAEDNSLSRQYRRKIKRDTQKRIGIKKKK